MQFEYLHQITAQETIDIDDIGNTAVQVFSAYGETCVLIIKTIDGISQIIEFGPINVDIEELPDKVAYSYERCQFNQRKLVGRIDKFIQNPSVIQVEEIDFQQAKSIIKNLVDFVIIDDNEIDYDRLV